MRQSLLVEVYFIAASATAIAALAWIGLPPAIVWPLGLIPYLGFNLYQLVRINLLIRAHRRLTPPFPPGLWEGVFRAIAEFQQSGRKRRKRQIRFIRRFREAAMSVPDALVILDRHKRVEWANPAAATLMDVVWPRDQGKLLTELLRHRQLGELIEAGEYARPLEIAPSHNRAITLSLRITPYGERKRQRLVVGRDVTKIYHLNMIRRDFVANASHELRTPLTVISGYTQMLVQEDDEAARREAASSIRRQVQLLKTMMGETLAFAKGERRILIRRVYLRTFFEDLAEQLKPELAEKGIRLELALNDRGVAHFDEEKMQRVFHNLARNAAEAIGESGGVCRLEVDRMADGSLLLTFSDDGPGVSEEIRGRLFESFTTHGKKGGTGLGLAIVQSIVEDHGGSVSVESRPGRTAFSIALPQPQPRKSTRPPAAAE